MNADSYRMLVLVREFDDRFGWKKWTYKSCAEWLAWRASISLSAAREKVRTAHALRGLPAIAAAFAEGRLVVHEGAGADARRPRCTTKICCSRTRSMRRCRGSRSAAGRFAMSRRTPSIMRGARGRSRSLTMWRDEARGTLRLTVEVPIEEGTIVRARLRGGRGRSHDGRRSRRGRRVERYDMARATGRCARRRREVVSRAAAQGGEGGATADHYQVVVHADAKALSGGAG